MRSNPSKLDHPHPCNYRLTRILDRGWGEMAFEYRWDSTSGIKGDDGLSNPDLDACSLYEVTTYEGNAGGYEDGWFYPPSPPFPAWRFRNPTDGRTAPVALGCFPASQGWAWDRHKIGGKLQIPNTAASIAFMFTAIQEYRFHCDLCGTDALVGGSHSGPHRLIRAFAALPIDTPAGAAQSLLTSRHSPLSGLIWRYTFRKHEAAAYMDIAASGYVDDSAHIGFGPA